MRTHKVHVRQDNTAVVICPHCGTVRTINVGKFRGRKDPFKVRCTCRTVFRLLFEFRNAYRKNTSLQGYYTRPPGAKLYRRMLVTNISLSGIRFATPTRHNLIREAEVKVRFTLDNRRRSEIEKKVVVRYVDDTNAGCEFTDVVPYDKNHKNLGFYLMP